MSELQKVEKELTSKQRFDLSRKEARKCTKKTIQFKDKAEKDSFDAYLISINQTFIGLLRNLMKNKGNS